MSRTLIISDMHCPYHHPDAFAFLKALYEEWELDSVKCVGDLIDNHTTSFHPTEYGALSPQDEHYATKDALQELESMFPEMIISLGNHDIMNKRKAKDAGIILDAFKNYNELYELKGGWEWVDRHLYTMGNGKQCLLTHVVSSSLKNNAEKFSHCSIQGHLHGVLGVEYYADIEQLRWSMGVGCLVNNEMPAFKYAKGSVLRKAIIGCGVELDGTPIPIAMPMYDKGRKRGRWTGKLP